MRKSINEIFTFLWNNEMDINRKAIVSIIKAFKLGTNELYKLDRTTKEYVVNNLFSDKERKKFFKGKRNRYFVDVTFKRVYNDSRR